MLEAFEKISGHLKIQYSVLSLQSDSCACLCDQARDSRVIGVPVPSAGLPTYLQPVQRKLSEIWFSQTQASMCLGHKREILLFIDSTDIFIGDVSYFIACERYSVIFSSTADQFVLLELVVHDLYLLFGSVLKHPAKHGVTAGNSNALGIDLWPRARQVFPHFHHGCVADLGISFDLYFALLGY